MLDTGKSVDAFTLSVIRIARTVENHFKKEYADTNLDFELSYVKSVDGSDGVYIHVSYRFPEPRLNSPSETGLITFKWYDPDKDNLITKPGEYVSAVETAVESTVTKLKKSLQ